MNVSGWILMMNICMFNERNDVLCVQEKADTYVYESRQECERQVDQYDKFKAWCKPVREE